MQARNLKVEYLTNPIGIDCTCPRLSWTCVGGVSQKAPNCKQKLEIRR